MSENQATVRYSFRLRPGKVAEARLILEWNCARYVWNQCVEVGNASYEMFKKGVVHEYPTYCRMSKKLTALRAEHDWLRAGSYVVQQQTVRKWNAAHQQAFKKTEKGFPKFHSSKGTLPSLEYTGNKFSLRGGQLRLVGGISIPVVWSRDLPSKPKSCVVTGNGAGQWSVSFVVRRKKEIFPPSNESIGIDWGVKEIATTTDHNFNLPCGNQINKNADALRSASRKLSRSKCGSDGRKRAKLAVARIHLRIARQRKDRAFKWARRVVAAFGKIAVEDFKPLFLAKTTMAKKATDGAVGMTKAILLTMAEAAARTVVLIPPSFTTQTCSQCGSRAKNRLSLSSRTFVCDACGHTDDRDRNAAWTIHARAGFNPTDGDDVRLVHDLGCAQAV